MVFLLNCIKGIFIGSGAILPGISSGVICIVFGLYEKLLDSLLNFFKDIKNNLKFLFPIILGIGIGVLIFSNFLNYFLTTYPLQTKSIFIGLILGSIPSLLKESNNNNNNINNLKTIDFLFLLFSFLIGIFLVALEKYIPDNFSNSFNFLYLFISGFAMSIGVVIPGISNTIILMLLGVYNIYLSSLSNIYLPVIIPMGLGLLLGCLVFMKLTNFLLKNFHTKTFFSIIGFSLGSIFVLIPNISSFLGFSIFFLSILLGFIIFSLFNKKD